MVTYVYGLQKINAEFCPKCHREAFVVDGQFTCCRRKCETQQSSTWKQIVSNPRWRKRMAAIRRRLVAEQDGQCIYCEIRFDRREWLKAHLVKKTIHVDHFCPFAFNADHGLENLVASCSVCNGIKADKIFRDLNHAREYIQHRRFILGYTRDEPVLVLSEVREAVQR